MLIKFSPYCICNASKLYFLCILLPAKYPEKAETFKPFTTGRKK